MSSENASKCVVARCATSGMPVRRTSNALADRQVPDAQNSAPNSGIIIEMKEETEPVDVKSKFEVEDNINLVYKKTIKIKEEEEHVDVKTEFIVEEYNIGHYCIPAKQSSNTLDDHKVSEEQMSLPNSRNQIEMTEKIEDDVEVKIEIELDETKLKVEIDNFDIVYRGKIDIKEEIEHVDVKSEFDVEEDNIDHHGIPAKRASNVLADLRVPDGQKPAPKSGSFKEKIEHVDIKTKFKVEVATIDLVNRNIEIKEEKEYVDVKMEFEEYNNDLNYVSTLQSNTQNNKPYKCTVCMKSFLCVSSWENHNKHHCNKNSLNQHHTYAQTFICCHCNKSFSSKTNLKSHLLAHKLGILFICADCGKSFSYKRNLKQHLRTHSQERPFTCDNCEKKFVEKSNLKRHLVTHTQEKPFSCDICHKSFARKGNLKTHLLVHAQEKPFSCDICDRRYSSEYSLKKHLLTHRQDKLFSCDICDKSFVLKTKLKSHLILHSEIKAFPCVHCEKSFSQKWYLTRHLMSHSQIKPFTCVDCNKLYTRKCGLKRHVSSKHCHKKLLT